MGAVVQAVKSAYVASTKYRQASGKYVSTTSSCVHVLYTVCILSVACVHVVVMAGNRDVEDESAREEATRDATESRRVPLESHQEHARQEGRTNQIAESVPIRKRLVRVVTSRLHSCADNDWMARVELAFICVQCSNLQSFSLSCTYSFDRLLFNNLPYSFHLYKQLLILGLIQLAHLICLRSFQRQPFQS